MHKLLYIIHVGNYYFNPNSASVAVGDTIRWVWDAGNHTTTSTTIPAGAPTWDSPISSGNSVYEYKVTVSGLYNYVCTPHAGMGMVGNFTAAAAAPTLSVTPSSRSVQAPAGSTSFAVTSNSTWTVSSNASWCSVTTGGIGNGAISADYEENTSLSQRTASITVTVSGLPAQIVTVVQAGAAAVLSVNPANISVTAAAGTANYSITTNTSWTASSSASWCTVTPSGNGNGTLAANYSVNSSNIPRSATITISGTGTTPQTVTLDQAGSTVGINEIRQGQFQVVPNPTKGIIQLKDGFSAADLLDIRILDISGSAVIKGSYTGSAMYTFDLTGMASGTYFMYITIENRTILRKIVLI